VQVDDEKDEYIPALQYEHNTAAELEYMPTLHVEQTAVPLVGENEPPRQLAQLSDVLVAEFMPAGQLVQEIEFEIE
jgi:hypothetical protein